MAINKLQIAQVSILATMLLHTSAHAASFKDYSVWTFECFTTEVKLEPASKDEEKENFTILWHRDSGSATIHWSNGNGKGLREIPGFTNNEQYSVHFWASPYTSKFTGKEAANGQYGSWVESFGPTMFSVRFTGEIAVTNHDIIYGGMKAFSDAGECTIIGKMN